MRRIRLTKGTRSKSFCDPLFRIDIPPETHPTRTVKSATANDSPVLSRNQDNANNCESDTGKSGHGNLISEYSYTDDGCDHEVHSTEG